jgi:hypothetical protein
MKIVKLKPSICAQLSPRFFLWLIYLHHHTSREDSLVDYLLSIPMGQPPVCIRQSDHSNYRIVDTSIVGPGLLLLALDWTKWQDRFSILTASVCLGTRSLHRTGGGSLGINANTCNTSPQPRPTSFGPSHAPGVAKPAPVRKPLCLSQRRIPSSEIV